MTLVKTGLGITDIRSGLGGVYFTRDKSGLHCTAKPRRVHQRSALQDKQRKAFSAARAISRDNRTVSYYMYRYLTGLPLVKPLAWLFPTGFIDSAAAWHFEIKSYDDIFTTFALNTEAPHVWTSFLELTHDFIYASKIRFWSDQLVPLIDIDVHDITGWHHVYNGAFVIDEWVEKTFSPLTIDKSRIRFLNGAAVAHLTEFRFWGVTPPIHYPVPLDYQIPRL